MYEKALQSQLKTERVSYSGNLGRRVIDPMKHSTVCEIDLKQKRHDQSKNNTAPLTHKLSLLYLYLPSPPPPLSRTHAARCDSRWRAVAAALRRASRDVAPCRSIRYRRRRRPIGRPTQRDATRAQFIRIRMSQEVGNRIEHRRQHAHTNEHSNINQRKRVEFTRDIRCSAGRRACRARAA